MSDPFLGSDEYGERAHRLYSEGRYDETVEVLREGLDLFPYAVDLKIGMGYARLAREEYAWARPCFEQALELEPRNEDALAGLGETLLKFGERNGALECFETILALGFNEDHDLMLQLGRALFREGLFDQARHYFSLVVQAHPDSSDASACFGYALHRLRDDVAAVAWLQRALELDNSHAEARIYLGNVLYDRGEYDAALLQYDRTDAGDHTEDLAVWRIIELKKSMYRLDSDDPELRPWIQCLHELARELEPEDRIIGEVEALLPDGSLRDPRQLDLFGTMLSDVQGMRRRPAGEIHRVTLQNGLSYAGTWAEIVLQMLRDDQEWPGGSVANYMEDVSRRSTVMTGVVVPVSDPESFVRGIEAAGLLTITR